MKFIAKIFVACLVGLAMMCIAIWYDASDRLAIASYFTTAIAVSALLGVFDMPKRTKHDSIRHKTERNYGPAGQAAVFIGTACLFVGTLKECEELADDLWHYAQQAEVRLLTGEETVEVI